MTSHYDSDHSDLLLPAMAAGGLKNTASSSSISLSTAGSCSSLTSVINTYDGKLCHGRVSFQLCHLYFVN